MKIIAARLTALIALALPLSQGTVLAQSSRSSTPGSRSSSAETDAAKKYVASELKRSTDFYLTKGYEKTSTDLTDTFALDEGETDDTTVYTLTGGRSYIVFGVCDEDCEDVNLAMYDSAGKLVAEDTEEDDQPAMVITVRKTGKYTLEVTMATCANEPCFYGINILRKK